MKNLSRAFLVSCFALGQSLCADVLFPLVDDDSIQAIAGNWKVTQLNQEEEPVYEGYLTLTPPVSAQTVWDSEGIGQSFLRVDAGGAWNTAYQTTQNGFFQRGTEVSGRTLKLAHSYGVPVYWGGSSIINFDSDSGTGDWSDRGTYGGKEHWERLRPTITRVEFGPFTWRDNAALDQPPVVSVDYGQVARLKGDYNDHYWEPGDGWPTKRPRFYVRVYGDNLWGYHMAHIPNEPGFFVWSGYPIFREGGRGHLDQIGLTFIVTLYAGTTNGRKVLHVDDLEIPFIYDMEGLIEPGPDLRFVDAKGIEIDEVMEGQVFAIEANFYEDEDYDADNPLQSSYTALLIQGDSGKTIPMMATPIEGAFRSGYYRVMQPRLKGEDETWSDWRDSGEDIQLPPFTTKTLSEHFAGKWKVYQADESGQKALSGEATVSADGEIVRLHVGQGDGVQHFEMYDADIDLKPDGTGPAYWVGYFSEYAEETVFGLNENVEDLWLDRNDGEISVALLEAEETLLVDYLNEARDPALLEVNFGDPVKDWLAGDWTADQVILPIGQAGNTIWSRGDPVIDDIVVISPHGPYPEDHHEPDDSVMMRRLLIVGENLPVEPRDEEHLGSLPESDDPLIEYAKLFHEGDVPEMALKFAYDDRKRPRPPKHKDYMTVLAKFEHDVVAGVKGLSLGSAKGDWVLEFDDANPQLRFARTAVTKTPLETVRTADSAFVELTFDHDAHLGGQDELEIGLFAGKKRLSLVGKLMAKRVEEEEDAPVFRTDSIFFYEPRYGKPDKEAEINLPVELGMTFFAQPMDPSIRCKPARVIVDESDYMVGEYWLSALNSAADVEVTHKNADEVARKTAGGFTKKLYVSRLLSGDNRDRTINFRNGDHAAAILIKDEFVSRMGGMLGQYFEQADNDEEVKKFIANARANLSTASRDPFWKYNKARWWTFPGGVPLWEILDTERFMERVSWSDREATEEWIFNKVKAALFERYRSMAAAYSRAENLLDSEVDEMLVFAGYRSAELTGAIVNRLVEKVDGKWVPDEDAIRYVEGLFTLGAAVRALEAYNEIDNTYNALAVAALTAGSAGALELGGYATAAAYTSMVTNAVDMVYSGGYGVYQYMKGEDRYEIATGLAPIYGDGVVHEAAKGRQSLLMTAAGLLFPAQAATRAATSIPGLKQIARGEALASKLGGDPSAFKALKDVDKADVLAYYKSIGDRRLSTAAGLTADYPPLKPSDLKNYRELRNVLNPKSKKALWEMTPAEREAARALQADQRLDRVFDESTATVRTRRPDVPRDADPEATMPVDGSVTEGPLFARTEPIAPRGSNSDTALSVDTLPPPTRSADPNATVRIDEAATDGRLFAETQPINPREFDPNATVRPGEAMSEGSLFNPTEKFDPNATVRVDEAATDGALFTPTEKIDPGDLNTSPLVGVDTLPPPARKMDPNESVYDADILGTRSFDSTVTGQPSTSRPGEFDAGDSSYFDTVDPRSPDFIPSTQPELPPAMREPKVATGELDPLRTRNMDSIIIPAPESSPAPGGRGIDPNESVYDADILGTRSFDSAATGQPSTSRPGELDAGDSSYFDTVGPGSPDLVPSTQPELPPTMREAKVATGELDPLRTRNMDSIIIPTPESPMGGRGRELGPDDSIYDPDLLDTRTFGGTEMGQPGRVTAADLETKDFVYYDPHPTGSFDNINPIEPGNARTSGLDGGDSGYFDTFGPGSPDYITPTRTELPPTEKMDAAGGLDPLRTRNMDSVIIPSRERPLTPKTEAYTPEELAARAAEAKAAEQARAVKAADDFEITLNPDKAWDPNQTLDPNKTLDPNMTVNPNQTLAPPADGGFGRTPGMDDPTGSFGVTPVSPNAPRFSPQPSPKLRVERQRAAAEEAVSGPFQGRDAMENYHKADASWYRQRAKENAADEIEQYGYDFEDIKGTPKYDEGLAELKRKIEAERVSAEANREMTKAAREQDHEIMDLIEKHTGYRTRGDYYDLKFERNRNGRDFNKQQAVAGTLANRYIQKQGTPKGTPQQHLDAFNEVGLNREQARARVIEWFEPYGNPAQGTKDFADRYLDWVGLK